MQWQGKIIGAICGYIIFRNSLGAIFGLIIGHYFDSYTNTGRFKFGFPEKLRFVRSQGAFYKATFLVMGHIAKSNGRVTEQDIHATRVIMDRLGLNNLLRRKAIELFNQGKHSNFDLAQALAELKRECSYRSLLQLFVELQIQVAMADGQLDSNKRAILEYLCQELGIHNVKFERGGAHYNHTHYSDAHISLDKRLTKAHQLLEVDQSVSDDELKHAYRRLMSQNHPDKLIAKGLPEDMIKLATEKTQAIKAAYDLICQERGI